MRKHPSEEKALALGPFQNMQIDSTEFPKIQRWKYLLEIADHLTPFLPQLQLPLKWLRSY